MAIPLQNLLGWEEIFGGGVLVSLCKGSFVTSPFSLLDRCISWLLVWGISWSGRPVLSPWHNDLRSPLAQQKGGKRVVLEKEGAYDHKKRTLDG